jgi:hypothetical protein
MTDETFILSRKLVEEIFQQLAREPYANVAVLINRLTAEVLPQINPPQSAPAQPTE